MVWIEIGRIKEVSAEFDRHEVGVQAKSEIALTGVGGLETMPAQEAIARGQWTAKGRYVPERLSTSPEDFKSLTKEEAIKKAALLAMQLSGGLTPQAEVERRLRKARRLSSSGPHRMLQATEEVEAAERETSDIVEARITVDLAYERISAMAGDLKDELGKANEKALPSVATLTLLAEKQRLGFDVTRVGKMLLAYIALAEGYYQEEFMLVKAA